MEVDEVEIKVKKKTVFRLNSEGNLERWSSSSLQKIIAVAMRRHKGRTRASFRQLYQCFKLLRNLSNDDGDGNGNDSSRKQKV